MFFFFFIFIEILKAFLDYVAFFFAVHYRNKLIANA